MVGLGLGSGLSLTAGVGGVSGPATSLQPIEKGNTGLGDVTIASGQAAQYTVHTVRGSGSGNLVVTLAAVTWNTLRGEIPLGNDMPYRVQIESPLGSGTFSTVVTGTVTNGSYADVDTGFAAPADGVGFGLFVWVSGAALPTRGTGGANNVELYTDEGCIVGASVSTTPSNAIADSFTRRRRLCACVGIFAQRLASATSVAVVGDSQQAFVTSSAAANSATSDHVRGDLTRTISQDYACINLGIGGDQPSTALYTSRPIWRMLFRRATFVANAYGINEFNNRSLTGAQALAFRSAFLPLFNGKRYADSKITPRVTATTDSYATEANQTVASYSADIDTFNTAIGAQANFIDRRTPLQGVNAQKWIVDGSAFYSTVDGLHMSLAGVGLVMATRTAIKAQIDAVTTPAAYAQPSNALTLTATPTFSGGKFTKGTATLQGSVASALPATSEFFLTVTTATAGSNSNFNFAIGSAGNVYVNTSGILVYRNAAGSTQAGTTAINDSVERHVECVTNATGTKVYLNGVLEITLAWTPTNVQLDKSLGINILSTNVGGVRYVASFVGERHTAGFTPPAAGYLNAAADATCVGAWPLTADGSGTIGGWMPS